MTVSEANAWLVTQAKDSKYANVEGKVYEYPQRIQYGRQIKAGDFLIVLLPSRDAVSGGVSWALVASGKSLSREVIALWRCMTVT